MQTSRRWIFSHEKLGANMLHTSGFNVVKKEIKIAADHQAPKSK